MAGFSQSAISRLESGGNLAYDTRVLRIAQRLLGIPPHLLGLSDDTVPVLADETARLFSRLLPGETVIGGRTAEGRTVPAAVDRQVLRAACADALQAEPEAVPAGADRSTGALGRSEAAVAEIDDRRSEEYRLGYWPAEKGSRCLVDVEHANCLLQLGDPGGAIALYEDARPRMGSLCRWEQALYQARFARAYARTGQVDRAAVLSREALLAADGVGYALVAGEVRKLAEWDRVPAAAAVTRSVGAGTADRG